MTGELTQVVRRLADVLAAENDALRAMDLPRAAALLAEKTEAFAALEAFRAEDAQRDAVADPAEVRRLDRLTSENRALLARGIAAQQRVIGIVVRAAASALPGPAYGAKGRMPPRGGPMTFSAQA